jgi:predicted AlkP superfamily phosphohydrolase/phosphomutase
MSGQKMSSKASLAILLILIVVFAVVVRMRIKGAREKPGPTVSFNSSETMQAVQKSNTKLIIIGIDGAAWKIITNQIGLGKLPNLKKLMLNGDRDILISEEPYISPALWTTYATGVSRQIHKIDNFTFKPGGTYRTESMDSRVRAAPALWEILSYYHKKVAVVNWYGGTPAEPVNGVFVADGAQQEKLSPENVYPAEWAERLKNIEPPRVEWFEKNFSRWNHPVIPKQYKEDTFVAGAALEILKSEHPDLMMVYFRDPDVVSHMFWKYRYPVGVDYDFKVTVAEMAQYGDVIDSFYQLLDELIGKLVEASPGYTIMIFSDHGQDATYPPKNIFLEMNNLLHELGFLDWRSHRCEDLLMEMTNKGIYKSSSPGADHYFECEDLKHLQLENGSDLVRYFVSNGNITPENASRSLIYMDQIRLAFAHPELIHQVNYGNSKLYNVDDYHKNVRGIYINLKGRDPEGIVDFKDYYRFRKSTVQILCGLKNEKNEKLFKFVKANPQKKDPLSKEIIDQPDIIAEFNPEILDDQYIFRNKHDKNPIFINSILFSFRDVSGDHIREGVSIISGENVTLGLHNPVTVYDLTPTVLWLFDAPIGRDMPGEIMNDAFQEFEHKPKYVDTYIGKIKIPVIYKATGIGKEQMERLKALGYIK